MKNLSLKNKIADYAGIKISLLKIKKINEGIRFMRETIPFNSRVKLHFNEMEDDLKQKYYHGYLWVKIGSKDFFKSGYGSCPHELYSSLESSIGKQIVMWKESRFTDEFTKIHTTNTELLDKKAA